MRWVRAGVGAAILLFQLAMIVNARFVPARYFCWAPYDIQTDYRLDVTIGGRELTAAEIRRRYRRAKVGSDNRSFRNLMDIVEQYERTYGAADHAQVRMRYRVNGKEEQEWRYPESR
ncbi:MAG TPA: hypothetical protein VL285_12615 [Bryobacteraceae bacterium]|jgi:hypothetical protein|nr:hypothetical protein [Bryobacteraceae bacterium]